MKSATGPDVPHSKKQLVVPPQAFPQGVGGRDVPTDEGAACSTSIMGTAGGRTLRAGAALPALCEDEGWPDDISPRWWVRGGWGVQGTRREGFWDVGTSELGRLHNIT